MVKKEFINLRIDDIIPYDKNPRINDDAVADTMESIKQCENLDPIEVDEHNVILSGHTRLKALKKLGFESTECVRYTGLSEAKKKKYRILANKVAEKSQWDLDLLSDELDGLDFEGFDFGFDDLDIDLGEEPQVQEDDYSGSDDVENRCKVGDLWQLGNHRLICGDSTDVAVIDRLMDGVKAECVFTDPPYNIASDSKNFAADVSKAMKNLSKSEWDKNFNIREVLDNILVSIAENATVYVCTSHFLASDIWDWMKEWADHYLYCVWSKPNPMPSLSKRHWTWNTELICYATRGKHTFNFPKEGHALSTWTINKKNGDTGHPTEKPVEVPAMAVSHSSKENDVVLDLFGGSGSTLIACEQLNRKCYMAELDPKYVSVIVNRWLNFTGRKDEIFCIRDGHKLTYDEVFGE